MISMDKKHRYRDGGSARVLCVDRPVANATVLAMSDSGAISYHSANGRAWSGDQDLIEVSPWCGFEIDDPVMVRDDSRFQWQRRHFSGISERGLPMTFANGHSMWTANSGALEWQECRRPTQEELEGWS